MGKKEVTVKIVAVNGSPNRNGNTAVLVQEAIRGAREAGAEVEEVFLADYRIGFCRGCLSNGARSFCLSTGRCVQADDLEPLRQKLYEADAVILASPSYGVEPTARMKNFLTDRFGLYAVYTSAMRGKYFLGLSTAGAVGAPQVARKLAATFATGFFGRGYVSGSLGAHVGHGTLEAAGRAAQRAHELGGKLVNDVRTARRYPLQLLLKRLLTRYVVRPTIRSNILAHKNGRMRGVYSRLAEDGVLS